MFIIFYCSNVFFEGLDGWIGKMGINVVWFVIIKSGSGLCGIVIDKVGCRENWIVVF